MAKNRIAGIWAFLIMLSLESFQMHKFYVSITEIHYQPENHHLEIILHTFPDDLLAALKKNYAQSPDLDKNPGESKKWIEKYLRLHFSLSDGQTPLPYTFLGYTFEDDRIILLMEARSGKTGQLFVHQSWLTDIYPSQQNIVHFIYANKKQTELLDKNRTETIFEIP